LLRRLSALYDQLCRGAYDNVWQSWHGKCVTIGQHVRVVATREGSPPFSRVGLAEAVDRYGRLGLRLGSGELYWIAHGEMTLRPI
jgi:biotin-(acetyl-CoA carboxylase) ligase